MELRMHLQLIKLELDTINAHGDIKGATVEQQVAVQAIEYQVDKAIGIEIIGSENDDEDSVLQRESNGG